MTARRRSARLHPRWSNASLRMRHKPVRNEAVIRVSGWVNAREPKPVQAVTLTSGFRMDFRERFFAPNAMRNSGARELLTPWRVSSCLACRGSPVRWPWSKREPELRQTAQGYTASAHGGAAGGCRGRGERYRSARYRRSGSRQRDCTRGVWRRPW